MNRRHAPDDDTGAALSGARWNPEGIGVLYAANSLSLCALEILVHVGGKRLVPDKYSWVAIDVPGDLIEKLADTVPEDRETSQRMGANWIKVRQATSC